MAEEEMTVKEMIAPGRGITIATHQGGTRTVIDTVAGEVVAAVTAVVAAGAEVGAKIESETVTEKETETGTEKGSEIALGAGPAAELVPEAGVETEIQES